VSNTWVAWIAVTVKIDELPAVIDVGFAEIVRVGAGFTVTVTVVAAEIVPPGPFEVAV
jgi:hypothetical protein